MTYKLKSIFNYDDLPFICSQPTCSIHEQFINIRERRFNIAPGNYALKAKENKCSKYTDIMMQRYLESVAHCPAVDLQDIYQDWAYYFYSNKPYDGDGRSQANPEYSHTSYLRMRHLEESYHIFNYLDEDHPLNLKLKNYKASQAEKGQPVVLLTKKERQSCLQRMYMLHEKKKYKIETLFIAVSIFDRYLMMTGCWNIDKPKQLQLSVICMVLAGKLEQPMQPCYDRMTQYLPDADKEHTTTEKLE